MFISMNYNYRREYNFAKNLKVNVSVKCNHPPFKHLDNCEHLQLNVHKI